VIAKFIQVAILVVLAIAVWRLIRGRGS